MEEHQIRNHNMQLIELENKYYYFKLFILYLYYIIFIL